jgi:hypothetical protein
MPHVLEPAPTGRAKCRGCGRPIAKDEVRFGERLPSPFADGEMTLWFHPPCAAYRRPESLLQALAEAPGIVPDAGTLERVARGSAGHRRLPRIDGAEKAPRGQAKCRSCREAIARGAWRIRLVFFEGGRFMPGGFVHLECREAYFEGHAMLDAMLHFSASLSDDERGELMGACGMTPGPAGDSQRP